jgi:hypothetical protein
MRQGAAAIVLSVSLAFAAVGERAPRIQVVPHEVAPRVDVLVRGKPYTSYVYVRSLPRPLLQSVRVTSGAVAAPEALWFRHADVNGIDFSADGALREDQHRGRIVHRRVIEASSSDKEGQLGVELEWHGPDDALMLVEDARFVFRDRGRARSIDRLTRLSAVRGPIRLGLNPAAVVGVRLPEGFLKVRTILGEPERRMGGWEIPASRGGWMAVEGIAGPERLTIALLDHPLNPGFPGRWLQDGSGLLANGIATDINIDAGRSISFRHRLVVFSGAIDPARMDGEFRDFSASSEPPRPRAPASTARLRTGHRSPGS